MKKDLYKSAAEITAPEVLVAANAGRCNNNKNKAIASGSFKVNSVENTAFTALRPGIRSIRFGTAVSGNKVRSVELIYVKSRRHVPKLHVKPFFLIHPEGMF